MPAVVIPSGHPVDTALQSLTGAAQGLAEANQRNETVNQSNADRSQRETQFVQSQGQQNDQFKIDLGYRLKALRQARDEGKLTREQTAKLALMEQIAASGRQMSEQDFQGGQNERERKKDLHIAAESEKTSRYGIRTQDQENKRRFALEKQRLVDETKDFNATAEAIAKYGDATKWTDEQKEAAFQEYLQKTGTPGETTGKDGVPQLTPEEIAVRRNDFLNNAAKHETRWNDIVTKTKDMTMAEASAKLVGSKEEDNGQVLKLDSIMDTSRVDPVSKYPMLKVDNTTLQGHRADLDLLQGLIASQAMMAADVQNPGTYDLLMGSYTSSVETVINNMKGVDAGTKAQLKNYYLGQMDAVFDKIAKNKARGMNVEVGEDGIVITDPALEGPTRIGVE